MTTGGLMSNHFHLVPETPLMDQQTWEAIRVNNALISNHRTPPQLVEVATKNRQFSEPALSAGAR